MTSPDVHDPLRQLVWLAVLAFCLGFAGFLALGGGLSAPSQGSVASFADSGLADDA